jgi:hypothetical protein
MFSGEWVDNRTRRQKQQDEERERRRWYAQQMAMFSQRDLAQFGVEAHPHMPLSDHTRLVLEPEDPRTPEEKEEALQRQAEQQTQPMFDKHSEISFPKHRKQDEMD